ncbi:FtsX-like permease family protein [Rhizobiaceae bacterium BDR2-2]|uniref:FtsX-like permease family protein n=1 Tax=Ectorhizobium quercum TaxID=2965071 RepID=A0AAE3N053_9HYPH|nr:FtsX-like permease family protein [Ectorhizobium quercum]MCX8998164.1 FtsX-like permease family protein [Ectorhizobium quercum]
MIGAGLAALLSHWRRHRLQLAMLLIGLCLATALWSGVQAINAEARASYDRAAALLGQDRFATLVPSGGRDIAEETYIALRRAGWRVAPIIEGEWRAGGRRLHLVGIDPVSMPAGTTASMPGTADDLLAFITPPGLVHVAPATLAELDEAGTPPLRADPGLLPGTALADIGIAQQLLDRPGRLTRLIVLPDQPAGRPALDDVASGLTLRPPDGGTDIGRLTESFHLNLTAFGFLAFIVGLFIVYSAIGLAFEQRRPTFRILRALGLTARMLVALVLAELLVFSLAAGLAGLALGFVVASLLMPGVAGTLNALYGAAVDGTLSLRPQWIASGLAISVGGTLLSAGGSLWRISRLPPLASGRPRAWARTSRRMLAVQSGVALALLAAAGLLALAGEGLPAGFAVLAFLLLGAALLWPGVLDAALGLAERWSTGVRTQWFWADTRQQIPGLALAFMALMLAFSANVGVSTMVASFRTTFTGWLDQRLASELYVTARNEDEARAVSVWLAARADAVLPMVDVAADLGGQPGQIYGVADHATYRDRWPLLDAMPDAWDRVRAGDGLLVNEQLYRRNGLRLGERLTLPDGLAPEIVGVYSDYGNPSGQAMIGIGLFTRYFPGTPVLRFGVRAPPDTVPALRQGLETTFGLGPANVTDQASIKARSLAIFEQTFAVTAALNVLTLGVAGIALFASMTTLSGMRLPQLAPVWAMGFTRASLAGLELLKTVLLVVATLLLAIPVGVALAWVLLAIVNVEAFGWRLPLRLFPRDWMMLAGFAVAAALVAAALPLVRLSRVAPADLLKVFAHER